MSLKMVDAMLLYLPIAAIVIAFVTLRTARGRNVETGSSRLKMRKFQAFLKGRKS